MADTQVMLNGLDFINLVQRQATELARALDTPDSKGITIDHVIDHIDRMRVFAVHAKELIDAMKAKAA